MFITPEKCGGITKAPNEIWTDNKTVYPYSQIICNYCGKADHKNWSWNTNKTELLKIFPECRNIKNITSTANNNTPDKINILSDKGGIILTKDELRLRVGRIFGWNKIYSNNYQCSVNKDSIIFIGHGFGHCIGFCQSGAEEMSKEGKTYKEILMFYYPNASL